MFTAADLIEALDDLVDRRGIYVRSPHGQHVVGTPQDPVRDARQGPAAGAGLLVDPGQVEAWWLEVELEEAGEETELTVRQSILNHALAPAVAAGCEYYLDRLVTLLEGGEVDALDYDAYFLRQAVHYRRLFPVQRSPRNS